MAAERTITRADLGDAWPLTVESGTLRCKPHQDLQILTIEAAGKVWALYGIAQGQGYADIEPIWAPNPHIPEAKIDIGPLIALARVLCNQ